MRTSFWLLLLFTGLQTVSSQCIDTVDFHEWIQATGSAWTVLSDTAVRETDESIPPLPSFFVSQKEYLNVRLSFDMTSQNTTDNDFVGFVLGYKKPFSSSPDNYEFILFDWKAGEEVYASHRAKEGFTLSSYHGTITSDLIPLYFWGHSGLWPNAVYEPISFKYGDNLGWHSASTYHIDVIYTSGSIKIDIDGNRVFDVLRCNASGRIGFYTFSQHDVLFSNLEISQVADAFLSTKNICQDDSIHFSVKDSCGLVNPQIRVWTYYFGDGDSVSNILECSHQYQAPGQYILTLAVEFVNGCRDSVSQVVLVQPTFEVDLGNDTALFPHSSIILQAGPAQAGWDYEWSNDSQTSSITLNDLTHDTAMWVWVTHGLCSSYDEIFIDIIEEQPVITEVAIDIPNAFTPNGDGINDTFFPVFYDVIPEGYSLEIFNRWGQEIFSTDDWHSGWDGRSKGKDCPSDVYVYKMEMNSPDINQGEKTILKKGNLLLLR